MMLRWKKAVAGRSKAEAVALMLMAGVLGVGTMTAGAQVSTSSQGNGRQSTGTLSNGTTISKIGPQAPVTYANRYEVYGGVNFMNFMAGQNLPKRMNMVGGEALGTYWVTKRIGVAGEFRGEYGTTPVLANPYTTRPEVSLLMGLGGVQVRGPKNQHAALDYHAYFGAAHGTFNSDTKTIPAQFQNVGMYSNHTAPIAALGGSIDFNRTKNLAVRLSPDLILERFGSGTREFFAISGGLVYRFGKK